MRDVRQENVVLLLLHYVPLLLLPCLVLGGGLRLMIHILSRNYRMMPRGKLWKRGSNRLIQILGRRKKKRRDRNENRRIKKKNCLEIHHITENIPTKKLNFTSCQDDSMRKEVS